MTQKSLVVGEHAGEHHSCSQLVFVYREVNFIEGSFNLLTITTDLIFEILLKFVGIDDHLIGFVKRVLVFKVLLMLLFFMSGKPLSKRNILIVEPVFDAADIIFYNNISNFLEFN